MQSTIAAMRPRMRTGVFFAPTPEGDGVLLTKGSDIVTFQGASTYAWLEKLSPHLDGRHSVGDLTASMRPATRAMVERLVGALHDAGLVRDVAEDEEHSLTERELEEYGAEIAFVEAFRASPALRFQRYRRTRLLVVGSGSVLAAAVEGTLLTGVAQVQSLDAGSLDASQLQRAVEAADLVLYAADRVDPGLLAAVDLACAELGRTLIPVTLLGEEAWVGPVCPADRPALRWGSLWRRLGSPDAARSEFLTGPVPGIVANHLVFRAFEHVTGVAEEDTSSAGVVRIDLETLQTSVHKLPAAPSESGELAERVGALTDERLGVLGPVSEGHYEQFPLRVVRVAVSDPVSPGASFPVWGAGADFAQAQDAALRHGLAAYAVRSGTGEALPVGTAAGATRDAAVEGALLDLCLRRLLGAAVPEEESPLALDDLELTVGAGRFRDLLLTTGEELSAYALRAPAGVTAYAFRLGDAETGLVERGVGFAPGEAAESGLGRLLLAHQAHSHGQTEYVPSPAVALWTSAEADAAPERYGPLVEALRADGLDPVVVPLDQDPAVHAVLPHIVRVVLRDA
ncbi:hypothetical protein [Streptomyces cupreus]|uniref:YcaO domain-containing protein n=1 Tax=Streptomyces cupreus TaxID=2759956 RepID=A0A7X1J5C7_9ACTN|nr:hypothetical protein [Streptomyces cupreus]MBC2901992.1 hypothetical protein [Streptomyces cupreus]